MFEYKAKLIKVIDGDTIDLEVDLGFNIIVRERFRLARIDTPELRSGTDESKQKGLEAKNYLYGLFQKYQDTCTAKTEKTEKYGRWLVEVQFPEGNASDLLVSNGYAVIWK